MTLYPITDHDKLKWSVLNGHTKNYKFWDNFWGFYGLLKMLDGVTKTNES